MNTLDMKIRNFLTTIAMVSVVLLVSCEKTEETPPIIDSTLPADNATEVVLNATVNANFSEDMDPLTLNATSFTLTQDESLVS
jgi:hypothetical protein